MFTVSRDSPYPRAKPSVEMFDQLASIIVYMHGMSCFIHTLPSGINRNNVIVNDILSVLWKIGVFFRVKKFAFHQK